jgi:hypothetical protein
MNYITSYLKGLFASRSISSLSLFDTFDLSPTQEKPSKPSVYWVFRFLSHYSEILVKFGLKPVLTTI